MIVLLKLISDMGFVRTMKNVKVVNTQILKVHQLLVQRLLRNVEAFATAAQGGKADTAMQRIAELTAKEQSNENNISFN